MLHYQVVNNDKNEWVTFFHGMGGSSLTFKKQLDHFSKYYNLLLIDLHGHGLSRSVPLNAKHNPTYREIAQDVVHVLNRLKIDKTHLVGISLGSIVCHAVADVAPQRIISIVLGGAVVKFGGGAKILISLGSMLKKIISYSMLYSFFAHILMPKRNHSTSRKFFIRESLKLGPEEFHAWFDLIKTLEKCFPLEKLRSIKIPKLYLSGSEDHMFIPFIKEYVLTDEYTELSIIDNSGHVCNIDSPEEFNIRAINFLRRYSLNTLYEKDKCLAVV